MISSQTFAARSALDRRLGLYAGWGASAIILTALLTTLLVFAHVPITFAALVALLIGSLVIVLTGECALIFARADHIAARPLAAIILGSVLTSIALVGTVVAMGCTAGQAFVVWSFLVFSCMSVICNRRTLHGRLPLVDLAVMAAIAVIIAVGCRAAAAAVPTLEATGTLPVWIDYYIHGASIANFGDSIAVGRGNILMSGTPLSFYHYGYYQLAAAIMTIVDASGLSLATAILLPLGLFLAAISAYVLATEMAGRRAGLLALAILVIVPDASRYGLANGFFGFQWLLFTNPGSGYGLAACAAALTMLVVWFRTQNLRVLVLAAILLAAVIQLRVHFFIWLAPALLGTVILGLPPARRHTRTLWSLGLVLLAVLLAALATIEPLRNVWLKHSVVVDYLTSVHVGPAPTAYMGLYPRLVETLGQVGGIFAGTALILPAMLGIFVLAYPAALIYAVRTRGWTPIDALPLLLLVVFVLVTLLAPGVKWGDVTEYQHRPFVLLYMVLVIWTSAYVAGSLPSTAERPLWISAGAISIAAAATLLVTTAGIDASAARFEWAKAYHSVPINPGITGAAREIRLNAAAGDIVAVGPVAVDEALADEATQLTSLTGVPIFLARYKLQMMLEGDLRQEAVHRFEVLQKIEASTDFQDVLGRLRANGVTWYVWLGNTGPRFDPERRNAEHADAGAAVYRVGKPSSR